MKKKFCIGKPYVYTTKSNVNPRGCVRLASMVQIKEGLNEVERKEMYFEFEQEYEPYLVYEKSDAFVVGLLTAAMEKDYDIEFSTPISSKLYYQLVTEYIPSLYKANPKKIGNVSLIGNTTSLLYGDARAVATGCSAGVDSFYTISKHQSGKVPEMFELTHILFASHGTLDYRIDIIENYYKKHFTRMKKLAKEIDCEAIGCFSNIHEFYNYPYELFNLLFATIHGSMALALQKLIGVYLESSGHLIFDFQLDFLNKRGNDGSSFDVFSLQCISTESLSFYSSGCETTRIEKLKEISEFEPALRHLTVCVDEVVGHDLGIANNCCKCHKCLRTIGQLYGLGVLDKFSSSFDTIDFYRNKGKRIGKMIGTSDKSYTKDMLIAAKENHIKIEINCYLWGIVYGIFYFFVRRLSNLKLVQIIYYSLKIDYLRHGYRDAGYAYYEQKRKNKI